MLNLGEAVITGLMTAKPSDLPVPLAAGETVAFAFARADTWVGFTSDRLTVRGAPERKMTGPREGTRRRTSIPYSSVRAFRVESNAVFPELRPALELDLDGSGVRLEFGGVVELAGLERFVAVACSSRLEADGAPPQQAAADENLRYFPPVRPVGPRPLEAVLDLMAVEDGGPVDPDAEPPVDNPRMTTRQALAYLDRGKVEEFAKKLQGEGRKISICIDSHGDLVTPVTVVAALLENGVTDVEVLSGHWENCIAEGADAAPYEDAWRAELR